MFDLNAKIWLEKDSKCIVGQGRIQLLRNIKELGSLSKAAEFMSMSYSHAWQEIKKISDAAGGPVISTEKGGIAGGGSQITELGEEILKRFEEEERSMEHYLLERNR